MLNGKSTDNNSQLGKTCKCTRSDKKFGTCINKNKCCDFFLEYTNINDGLIKQKSLCCNKNYQRKLDEKLKKPFLNAYKLSNHNKFILLLPKSVYPCQYMNDWKKSYTGINPDLRKQAKNDFEKDFLIS